MEYLAARKPVISTPIADVVDPYGQRGLVAIAALPKAFVKLGERILCEGVTDAWHREVETVVREASWDATVERMERELQRTAAQEVLARWHMTT